MGRNGVFLMRVLLAVTAVVVSCVSVEAQVSISESGIRARLVDGTTTITLPVRNAFQAGVEARLDLRWLAPNNKEDGEATRTLVLAPGDSTVEIALPIGAKVNPHQERLSYRVRPSYPNLTSFDETRGTVSLVNIADYAFTLRVVTPAFVRPKVPTDVRVFATNPVSGQPVGGVTVTRGDQNAVTDRDGVARLTLTLETDDDLSDDHITWARLATSSKRWRFEMCQRTRARRHQLDKPIYQPGQTMHVRILKFGEDGKAHAGVAEKLEIEKQRGRR